VVGSLRRISTQAPSVSNSDSDIDNAGTIFGVFVCGGLTSATGRRHDFANDVPDGPHFKLTPAARHCRNRL
jgi:hypothetical protein